jgi:hypothetical protein
VGPPDGAQRLAVAPDGGTDLLGIGLPVIQRVKTPRFGRSPSPTMRPGPSPVASSRNFSSC